MTTRDNFSRRLIVYSSTCKLTVLLFFFYNHYPCKSATSVFDKEKNRPVHHTRGGFLMFKG